MSVRQLDGAVGACLHTCEHGFKPHMSSAAGILREGNPEPRAGTLLRSILAASDCGAARIGLLSAVPQLQTTSADRTTVIAPISPTLSAQQLGLGVWPVLFMGHSSAIINESCSGESCVSSSSSSIYSQPIRPSALESSSSRSQTGEDSTVPASYNRSLWRNESTGAEHIQTRTAAEAARNQVIVVR